jgi:glyoxalase family protein
LIHGIHHVTALADAPQRNVDFYAGVLGLRLVKKTVNFDAPEVYHLYYGNELGAPGTIMTFFLYEGIRRGRHGTGMVDVTSFSAPLASMEFWRRRLEHYGVAYQSPRERWNEEIVISLKDPDGLGLELVFNEKDTRPGFTYGRIPIENSIRGFYRVEIWEEGYEKTAGLLTGLLDHRLISENGNRFRFAANDAPGAYIDLVCAPDRLRGLGGGGTVHHIAFATPDTKTQLEARERILDLDPTPVIDRQYFKSVYFREPGGVLFEIATVPPGFSIDEAPEELGSKLKLPPQYEPYRDRIDTALSPVSVDLEKY